MVFRLTASVAGRVVARAGGLGLRRELTLVAPGILSPAVIQGGSSRNHKSEFVESGGQKVLCTDMGTLARVVAYTGRHGCGCGRDIWSSCVHAGI
jgi:hypothetical protein